MFLRREFSFDAAHHLPRYLGKCEALHGHTYHLAVVLRGSPDHEGMVMDFTQLKQIVQERVLDKLDHTCLNDLIPQPTAEEIAKWIWRALKTPLERPNCTLHEIQVWETASCSVLIHAEDMTEEDA